MWYISKAPWYNHEVLDSSEKVYRDFALVNYGENAVDAITDIIDQNEPFATDFGECQETPGFNQMVHTYPLMNLYSMTFWGKNGKDVEIKVPDMQRKKVQKMLLVMKEESAWDILWLMTGCSIRQLILVIVPNECPYGLLLHLRVVLLLFIWIDWEDLLSLGLK